MFAFASMFRRVFGTFVLVLAMSVGPETQAEPSAILVGLDAEMGLAHSTSGQAIERGILTAIEEINTHGGVLGGHPLRLVVRDNRSMPARAAVNVQELAAMPGMVAIFGGRFSPAVMEAQTALRDSPVLILAPWSSAELITTSGLHAESTFRLSLRDSVAMPGMLAHAAGMGIKTVGLLMPNSAWGRSNVDVAQKWTASRSKMTVLPPMWYNFTDESLLDKYLRLLSSGAQAVILVANEPEGAVFIRDVASLPPEKRIPIISHWGVTGGQFAELCGDALKSVDLTVVQSFSMFRANPDKVASVLKTTQKLFGIARIERIESPVGFAHAYDLTHILARAITLAGSSEPAKVRDAMEQVRGYDGLVRKFSAPFEPGRHDALGAQDVMMVRYREDGVLVPAQ